MENITKVLRDTTARSRITSNQKIETSFKITSNEYLDFAIIDIEKSDTRNIVNALSNAKRAIDSRIDTLLVGFTYYNTAQSKRWGVPTKLERLSKFGIIAPRILLKLNKKRNLLEHQFIIPSYEEVEDFIDVASLFIYATDSLVYQFPISGVIISDDCNPYGGNYIKLDYLNEKLILHEEHLLTDMGEIDSIPDFLVEKLAKRKIYTVTREDDEFDNLLECFIRACTKINRS